MRSLTLMLMSTILVRSERCCSVVPAVPHPSASEVRLVRVLRWTTESSVSTDDIRMLREVRVVRGERSAIMLSVRWWGYSRLRSVR